MYFCNTKSTFDAQANIKFAPRSNASVRPPPREANEGAKKTEYTVGTFFLYFLNSLRAVQAFFSKKSEVDFSCKKIIQEARPLAKTASDARIANNRNTQRAAAPAKSGSGAPPRGQHHGCSKVWFLQCKVHLRCVALERHASEVDFVL